MKNDSSQSFKVDPSRISNQLSQALIFYLMVLMCASCAEAIDTHMPTQAKRDKGTSGASNSASTGSEVGPAVTPKVTDPSSTGQPPAPPAPVSIPPATNPSGPPPVAPPPPASTALCTPQVNCTTNSISEVLLRCSTFGQNPPQSVNLYTGQDSCPKVKAAIDGVGLPSGSNQIAPTLTGGPMLSVSCENSGSAYILVRDGNPDSDIVLRSLKMPNSVCWEFRDRLNSLQL